MKRYIIVDPYNGEVYKTDDTEIAHNYAECDDIFVIDTQEDKVVCSSGETCDIEELS